MDQGQSLDTVEIRTRALDEKEKGLEKIAIDLYNKERYLESRESELNVEEGKSRLSKVLAQKIMEQFDSATKEKELARELYTLKNEHVVIPNALAQEYLREYDNMKKIIDYLDRQLYEKTQSNAVLTRQLYEKTQTNAVLTQTLKLCDIHVKSLQRENNELKQLVNQSTDNTFEAREGSQQQKYQQDQQDRKNPQQQYRCQHHHHQQQDEEQMEGESTGNNVEDIEREALLEDPLSQLHDQSQHDDNLGTNGNNTNDNDNDDHLEGEELFNELLDALLQDAVKKTYDQADTNQDTDGITYNKYHIDDCNDNNGNNNIAYLQDLKSGGKDLCSLRLNNADRANGDNDNNCYHISDEFSDISLDDEYIAEHNISNKFTTTNTNQAHLSSKHKPTESDSFVNDIYHLYVDENGPYEVLASPDNNKRELTPSSSILTDIFVYGDNNLKTMSSTFTLNSLASLSSLPSPPSESISKALVSPATTPTQKGWRHCFKRIFSWFRRQNIVFAHQANEVAIINDTPTTESQSKGNIYNNKYQQGCCRRGHQEPRQFIDV